LLPFFGDYYLELRSQSDPRWGVLPEIKESITENDDTVSFIVTSEGHHTKRYYVTQNKNQFKIERIMIECDLCNGKGKILQMNEPDAELEECPLCDGRGWDDWLD
jgi:rubrerythrin